MTILVDTSVLVRLANTADPSYAVADRAVVTLHGRGEMLHLARQCLVEFRNVATRPVAVNGLGLAPLAAEAKAAIFEAVFSMMPETPAIYAVWKALVNATAVIGKQVHDARLAAICHVCGVTHLLTFNSRHFAPFAGFGPGLIVIDPATV